MVVSQANQRGSLRRSRRSTIALRTAEIRTVKTSGTKNGRPTTRSASKARLASSQFAAFLLSLVMQISSAAQNLFGRSIGKKTPSVVDLKFLRFLWHPRLGTSNPKTTLDSINCQCGLESEIRPEGCLSTCEFRIRHT